MVFSLDSFILNSPVFLLSTYFSPFFHFLLILRTTCHKLSHQSFLLLYRLLFGCPLTATFSRSSFNFAFLISYFGICRISSFVLWVPVSFCSSGFFFVCLWPQGFVLNSHILPCYTQCWPILPWWVRMRKGQSITIFNVVGNTKISL